MIVNGLKSSRLSPCIFYVIRETLSTPGLLKIFTNKENRVPLLLSNCANRALASSNVQLGFGSSTPNFRYSFDVC